MSSRKPASHSLGGVVPVAPPASGSVVQSSEPDGAASTMTLS